VSGNKQRDEQVREFRRWFVEMHQAEIDQHAAALLSGKTVRLRWDAQARKIVSEVVEP
jgi:hypothetical protein